MIPDQTKIQPWFDTWLKEHETSTLHYKDAAAKQVMFVRDTLSRLLYRDVNYKDLPNNGRDEDTHAVPVDIIGEHRSKSVRLPVYSIARPDKGLGIVLRDNFYDWNVTVLSDKPISKEDMQGFVTDYTDEERRRFPNGFRSGSSWGYCFFQGFPPEFQFGPWAENPRAFSLYIRDNYSLYTFVWLLTRGFDSKENR